MKRIFIILGVLLAFIISLIFVFSNIIIDMNWFNEIGYLSTYFVKFKNVVIIFLVSLVFFYSVLFLYNKIFLKNIISNIYIKDHKIYGYIYRCCDVMVLLISIFTSFVFSFNLWDKLLLFLNSENFNIKDPIFSNDVSLYVFKLPFISYIVETLYSIFFLIFVFTLVLYVGLTFFSNKVYLVDTSKINTMSLQKILRKKLALFGFLVLSFLSVIFVLKSFNLVYSKRGVVFGASYTDVKVSLIFYIVIAVLCILSAVISIYAILKSKMKIIFISLSLIFGLSIVEPLVAGFFQNLFVKANEYEYEKKYIDYNIDFTQKAFNISNIDMVDIDLNNDFTIDKLKEDKDIINNLKINSHDANLQFFRETQLLRYYYNFKDLDTDRYNINGNYTQVFIAPREIDSKNIDNSNWQSKHMYYTHGYGVVLNSVSSVNKEGQPDYLLKDMPQQNLTDILLENPRIYFGENTDDYVIVNTDQKEFDYPKENGNEEYRYTGDGGIKLNFLNKILFALKEKNIRFLTSSAINNDSKILINRNILDRVEKIAPFLIYDNDPYLIIDEGRLFWMIDAYTVSNRYPFSEPVNFMGDGYSNKINYIRNSVKVVIDAYNGTTDFYIVDQEDPIINAYSKIFSDLFKPFNSMPQNLKNHMKYPQIIFNIQSDVLRKYHTKDSRVFFNNEDLWDISRTRKTPEGDQILNEATYLTAELDSNKGVEMVLLEYFNSRDKENMVSIFGARMDEGNYGDLFMYKFPPQDVVFGINLFKNKYNQDPFISKEISLWDTKGSEVLYGDTLIFPIGDSLLYLEPLYLKAGGDNSIPELKRIILYYNDKMVIGNDIQHALELVFSEKIQDLGNVSGENIVDVTIQDAKNALENAIKSQREGNWGEYGKYLDDLSNILSKLE